MSSVSKDNRFAVIPHWVIRSGISSGALHLYTVLTMYADNRTGEAFPARSTLAKDMGKSSRRTVDTYIKELKDAGALKVQTRRRASDGGNTSSLYTVITAKPHAQNSAMPRAEDSAQNYTHITTPTSFTSDPDGSDLSVVRATASVDALHQSRGDQIDRYGITGHQRQELRGYLTRIGKLLSTGNTFHDEPVTTIWDTFCHQLDIITEHQPWNDTLGDLIWNGKWTISAKVADPYEAGVELNKLLATASTY